MTTSINLPTRYHKQLNMILIQVMNLIIDYIVTIDLEMKSAN